MIAFNYDGVYNPNALRTQLAAAGIDVLGLTCVEDDSGTVTSVQVICDDVTSQSDVDAAVAAYVPPPSPAEVEAAYAAAPATAQDHASASAAIVTEKLAAVPVSREALPTILQTLLGEASAGIPFFENAVANWSNLTPQQKDECAKDACRVAAAVLRYLTGDLPTS